MSTPRAALSQSQLQMTFLWLVDSAAVFAYGDEDDPDYLNISREVWEDMGKPQTLTVTIQPGDLLNET